MGQRVLMVTVHQGKEKGMTCKICQEYEQVGTFVTGCKNFKKDSISSHEKSDSHQMNTKKQNAKVNQIKL
jgi:ribosomal protein L24